MNTLRTIVLLGCLTALMVAVGGAIGGREGMLMAFVFACITNLGSYWFSSSIALSMSGAQPVSREQAPELYEIVERIAARAKIPAPPIYVIPTATPNAFATGRDPQHAAVAVTEGILQMLNATELEAVLSHELGHVRNHDVLIATIAAVLASVITTIAHWGMYFGGGRSDERENSNPVFMLLLIILAPIAASLINLAVSRSREYEADATGAQLCGHPLALASALAKIEEASYAMPMRGNPALSSLYIMKPDPQSWFVNIFSTHPPTEERIKRLKEMAAKMR